MPTTSTDKTNIRPILFLYLLGTFSAALTAVVFSFLFPSTLHLTSAAGDITRRPGLWKSFADLLMSMVSNPITALMSGNYIGILVTGDWSGLRAASRATRPRKPGQRFVQCRDFHGEAGDSLCTSRYLWSGFFDAGHYRFRRTVGLRAAAGRLVGCMLLVALVINPLLVFWQIRRNPYPLVLTCLRESGVYAFFTRSSAANIPVNMALAGEAEHGSRYLFRVDPAGCDREHGGAAITITVLTLAAVHTLGIPVDLPTALLLSVVASLCACGASGVAGGSLLLIPLACNMFGIPNGLPCRLSRSASLSAYCRIPATGLR